MKEAVIVGGVRTPFIKAGTLAKNLSSQELGRQALVALMRKVPVNPTEIDQVIMGCVAQPIDATNIARVAAINAGLPLSIPAYTVQRNCSSSMQAVTNAVEMIEAGSAEVIVAGGMESLSNAPLIYNRYFTDFFSRLARAKTRPQKLAAFLSFRLKMLNPRIGIMEGLTDPTCGMIMGDTAELLGRDLGMSRHEQDQYSTESHIKAASARKSGRLAEEIIPLFSAPEFAPITEDNGIRADQSLEMLAKLKPMFDKRHGTVTAGNSSQISDGAVAMIVTTRERAEAWGIKPLIKISGSAYAGLEPRRMGLGPVAATAKLLGKLGRKMSDMQLVELNEAFASQTIACLRLFESDKLSSDFLGLAKAPGAVDPSMLNVNGGAIAPAHPCAASAGRLLLSLAINLQKRNLQTGLAALCIGGRQGAAFILERTAYTQ